MKKIKAGSSVMVIGLVAILLTGCDPSKKWAKQEKDQIQAYLKSAGDTVYDLKPNGLYFHEIQTGSGASPSVNDTVAVIYKGSYLTGQVVSTNYNDSTNLLRWVVGQLTITGGGTGMILIGLDEGITFMKEGGKAKMLLPSALAYGAFGYLGVIPGYTPLLFTVELKKVSHSK